jgi:hypothetical protein
MDLSCSQDNRLGIRCGPAARGHGPQCILYKRRASKSRCRRFARPERILCKCYKMAATVEGPTAKAGPEGLMGRKDLDPLCVVVEIQ